MTQECGTDAARFQLPGDATALPAVGAVEQARQADPDRFLCILTAPRARRAALASLILFNHELVRATELPSARSGAGPIATLIRLQWWREVVDGARDDWHRDPVAVSLRALVERVPALREPLGRMIDARERESEGMLSPEEWRTMLQDGAGGLQRAIGLVLGVATDEAPRLVATGAAFAAGALRRYLPALLSGGRVLLPDEITALDLGNQRRFLAAEGERFLAAAAGPALPRPQRAVLLPLVLARRDLRGDVARFDSRSGARGLGDRLAVIVAGLR